jgi:hypothetical protein
VLVGAQPCLVLNASDSFIICNLPSGRTLRNVIVILQSTGRIFISDTTINSVSYQQCNLGQVERPSNPLVCDICPAGTFSAIFGAQACTVCPPGYVGFASGRSTCDACLAGTQWIAGQCQTCPLGSYTAVNASVSCLTCPKGSVTTVNGASVCFPCTSGFYVASPSLCGPCDAGTFSSTSAATTCQACPSGSVALSIGSTACTPCNPGSSTVEFVANNSSASRICQPCRTGTFSSTSAATSCQTCPSGLVALSIGSTACNPCNPGSSTVESVANDSSVSRICQPCVAGTFAVTSGSATCAPCAANFFSPFQGLTTCVQCQQFSTSQPGSSICSCGTGYYSVGSDNSSKCIPCPVGAVCTDADSQRTVAVVRSQAGYWRVPSVSSPTFLPCPFSSNACPSSNNGSCATGYGGVMCGVCQLGYHASSTSCTLCRGSVNAYALPVVIVGAVLVLVFAYWVSTKLDTSSFVSAAKILVSFVQVLGSSASSYDIPWPDFMQNLLTNYRVFLLDIFQVTSVDCYVPYNFFLPFYFTLVGTLSILLITPIFHRAIPILLKACNSQRDRHYIRNMLVKTVSVFMTIFCTLLAECFF